MGEWLQVGPAGNRAYLAVPEEGSGAGVLVLHAWWGLTPDFTDVCDRLAAAGIVALAPSLYTNDATADTIDEAEALIAEHDRAPKEAEAAMLAATDHLLGMTAVAGPRIGVIGFSMGAYWALHLSTARPDVVSAVVTVYGTSDADFSAAEAAFLGHFAEQDDYEPQEAVRELASALRSAGREVAFHTYAGVGHWFVEPSRPDAFDPAAADLVWERTLAFLKTKLG